jgi:mRNA (guanine-N7-)-methyltransferase
MSKRRLSDDFEYVHKVARGKANADAASQAHLVAQHYNARPEVGLEKRKESTIIRLRSFNNWVKSVLISRHVRKGNTVLDMGCGKGGDLQKWGRSQIGYLVAAGRMSVLGGLDICLGDSVYELEIPYSSWAHLDIADVSLQQMKGRYRTMRNAQFNAEFIALDCYNVRSFLPTSS